MFPAIAIGVSVGILGAVMMWSGGQQPMIIGLAYSVTGMFGALGWAAIMGVPRPAEQDICD